MSAWCSAPCSPISSASQLGRKATSRLSNFKRHSATAMPAETAIDALVELRDGLVALGENPERLTELHNGPYVRAVRHAAKMRDDEHRTRVEAVGTVLITAMLAKARTTR